VLILDKKGIYFNLTDVGDTLLDCAVSVSRGHNTLHNGRTWMTEIMNEGKIRVTVDKRRWQWATIAVLFGRNLKGELLTLA